MNEFQKKELEVFQEVEKVLTRHGLRYFAIGGTCIGAIRHHGFIPWDDDIDLGMPRADYDRFVAEAPKLLGDDYVVSTPETNQSQAALFCKIWLRGTRFVTEETIEAGFDQGIFIDITPYDLLSSDEKQAAKQQSRCRFWQRMSYLYHAKSIVVPHGGVLGAAERASCGVAHVALRAFLTHDKIVSSFNKAAKLAVESGHVSDELFSVSYGPYEKSMMLPPLLFPFEGHDFPMPAQPEAYLALHFGDWRELPPVEKRRNHAPVELDFGGIEP